MAVSAPTKSIMTRSTTFEQEVTEISKVRKLRRSQIKKYPSVSVVIATLRESDLENILQQMALQTLPKFEIWLGLHEIELNPRHKTLIRRLNTRGIKVSSKKFPKSATLGEVLTQISNLTTGELVAKIDDDDYYGPEHLRDLVDALMYNEADVAGRAMNYVYLEPLSITVRRFAPTGTQAVELWSDWVCGGTILVKRSVAESVGWFGSGTSAVDRYLLSGVTESGGKIWRTFGAGYIYRRTFTFHTYITNYSKYLNNANEQRVGLWSDSIFGTTK